MHLIENFMDIKSINQVPKVIWCYWAGPPMQGKRLTDFEKLIQEVGVPVFLITPENVASLVKPEAPFPKGFVHLSAVHQSDLVRAYMMHHYGGAWHDIDAPRACFKEAWKVFEDPNVYICGMPEIERGVADVIAPDGRHMRSHYDKLIAVPAWVARPQTDFSQLVWRSIHEEIENKSKLLEQFPARSTRDKYIPVRNYWQGLLVTIKHKWAGRNPHYPILWTLFGNSFHQAQLSFPAHINRTLKPVSRG
jgi:hypothetical protein